MGVGNQTHSRAGRVARREFLKSAAWASAALAVPQIVPASVFGENAPSNRVNVGFIGCGNQSTIDLPAFLGNEAVQVLAVCDVNTASYGYRTAKQFLGRKPVQESVNRFYAEKNAAGAYQGCDAYGDFREVLARKDVDAVAIVVPDHWHGLMTVMAARAGKDMYCEKPMSLCIEQGKEMVRVVREQKRILQCGSHYRSSPAVRLACELVRNGRIGKLQRITAIIPPNNPEFPGPGVGWQPEPVPEGFDYDMWLGPAPQAPYHHDRCFYRFRFILDYSGGQVTNFGAHAMDIGQLGNGTSHSGPVEIEDLGSEWPPKGSLFTTATRVHFRALYANGVEMVCQTKLPTGFGTRFEGTEGTVEYGYKGVTTTPASLKSSVIGPHEEHLYVSNPNRKDDSSKYYIPDNVRNFIECVKTRKDPVAAVEIGHRTATLCHLGNIAMRLKRKVKWDPEQEAFVNDAEATALMGRALRAPWHF
jgi:hypothetical protein